MKKKYNVVILAGGFGSRMGTLTKNLPKPMIKINKKPIIETQIEQCSINGFSNILILAHYLPQKIVNYFSKKKQLDVNIDFNIEIKPRGTAGAIKDVLDNLDRNFLIIYGDIYFNINLREFYKFHKKKSSNFTAFIHPNDHPYDSDLVSISNNSEITSLDCYPHPLDFFNNNLVTAGLYFASKDIFNLECIDWKNKKEITKDLIPLIIKSKKFNIYGYHSREYAKDMGTTDRLKKVRKDIRQQKQKILSLESKSPAIFLDRDGTIIEDVNYLQEISQVKFIDNSISAIKKINDNGFASIVITNQPVIARGELSLTKLDNIHSYIDYEIGKCGAFLDAIYFCPHHPDDGYKGEVKELKIVCKCRKPKVLLASEAIKKFNIDRASSWMIGDSTCDVLFGKKNKLKTILLRTGKAGADFKYNVLPDFISYDLEAATEFIFNSYNKLLSSISFFLEHNSLNRIIFVGGISQSGKSTFASMIKQASFKKKMHIINLDGFLKNNHDLSGIDFKKKYQIDRLYKIINYVIDNPAGSVNVPIYERAQKKSLNKLTIKYTNNDSFIFEGTIMLTIFKNVTASRFYIKTSKQIHKKRFISEYKWRGLSIREVNKLYNMRETEFKFISSESQYNYLYRMDKYDFSKNTL